MGRLPSVAHGGIALVAVLLVFAAVTAGAVQPAAFDDQARTEFLGGAGTAGDPLRARVSTANGTAFVLRLVEHHDLLSHLAASDKLIQSLEHVWYHGSVGAFPCLRACACALLLAPWPVASALTRSTGRPQVDTLTATPE